MTNPAKRVVDTLSGSYLNRWRLTSEEEAAWIDGLQGFTPEVLRKATNDARVDFPEWPPTLMEFRRYCVNEKRKGDDTSELDIIEKYNSWAKDKGMAQKMPNESLEEFRHRLVWQYECRRTRDVNGERRSLTSSELSEIVAENREANKANARYAR